MNAYRLGIEGELYADRFRLSGVVGAEWGDVDDGLFTIADAHFYATDNFMLSIGHRYAEEAGNAFAAGVEYLAYSTANTGVSLFADARFGEHDYQSIFGGLKLYFGEDKTLIRRHREDDPPERSEDQSVISCLENLNFRRIPADGVLPAQEAQPLNIPLDTAFTKYPCNRDFNFRPL